MVHLAVMVKRGTKEDEIIKRDFSAFSMAMKAGAAKGDEMKAELLSHYQNLGRFDKEKAQIVSLWQKDKGCSWWVAYKETKFKTKVTAASSAAGWGSRHTASSTNIDKHLCS